MKRRPAPTMERAPWRGEFPCENAKDMDRTAIQILTKSLSAGVKVRALPPAGPAYTLSPEPMTDDPILDAQGRPRSVWSALLTLDARAYRELVSVAYGYRGRDADQVIADGMLYEAVQTRKHEPLPSGEGWAVWIDSKGAARVQVYP